MRYTGRNSTDVEQVVDFTNLHQVFKNQICCILIFADFLQVVELTTCMKLVNKNIWQSTCIKTVDNSQTFQMTFYHWPVMADDRLKLEAELLLQCTCFVCVKALTWRLDTLSLCFDAFKIKGWSICEEFLLKLSANVSPLSSANSNEKESKSIRKYSQHTFLVGIRSALQ